MRRISAVLLLCATFLPLSGCTLSVYNNYRELERLQVIETVGLDAGEDGGVVLSVSSGRDASGREPLRASAEAPSVTEAMQRLQDLSRSDELFFSGTGCILIGEAAAAQTALLLVAWLMRRLCAGAGPGEDLGCLILRGLGRGPGAALLFVYGLWLVFYAGFSLRSSASRFIYTIYPGAPPWPFVAAGLAAGLAAVLSPGRALARASELFRWLLLLALAPILLLGLADVDFGSLLPVYPSDALPVLEGALPALGAGAFLIVNIGFLDRGPGALRGGRFSLAAALVMLLIVGVTLGRFGPELTGRFTYPFFALVRNTSLFGVAERIEALVTALWVFSDFVLFAFALSAGAGCLRLALGLAPEGLSERHGAFEMRGGRWLIWLYAALAGLTAALIAPDSASLKLVSELVAPGLNLLAIFGLILPALLIGRARRKI